MIDWKRKFEFESWAVIGCKKLEENMNEKLDDMYIWMNFSKIKLPLMVGLSRFSWCQNFVLVIFLLTATKHLFTPINPDVYYQKIWVFWSSCREEENHQYEVLAPTESWWMGIPWQTLYHCHVTRHSVSKWIWIKSQPPRKRLSWGHRGPYRGTK